MSTVLNNLSVNVSLSTAKSNVLVFIDAGVEDYQFLADGVVPEARVFILDRNLDGIEQITEILSEYSAIDSIHLVSHGSPGSIQLGNSYLSLDTLAEYESKLQSWSAKDILVYGCNIAAGDAGTEFVNKLRLLTRANIAASTTKIGNSQAFQNWELETYTTSEKPNLVFLPKTLRLYDGLFADVVVFDNGLIVDTSSVGVYPESDNIQAALTSLGHTVSTFTGISSTDINTALTGKSILLIPEQENDSLISFLDLTAKTAISDFVLNGGGLVINGEFRSKAAEFLNGVFGFSLTELYPTAPLANKQTTETTETEFADDPNSIPTSQSTTTALTNLPSGASSLYSNNNGSIVTLIPFGAGNIIFLGWSWFNGAPVGSVDSGWLNILDSAILQLEKAPSITSPAAANINENNTFVADIDTNDDNDSEGSGLTYRLTGGADQALFSIDESTGQLSFVTAPDFETPGDSDTNNEYSVQVTVTDADGLTDVQDLTVNVTDVNEAPIIQTADTVGVAENTELVVDVNATDVDNTPADSGLTYSLTGGADRALFSIDESTGQLSFVTAPDFETPGDFDANNAYSVQVTVTDADGLTDVQDLTVNVTDVNEAPTLVTSIENQIATEGNVFGFSADNFNDVDAGDSLTYTATLENGDPLPDWLELDSATVDFSGTPATGDIGNLSIKIVATDLAGEVATDTFELLVNANPTVAGTFSSTDDEDDSSYILDLLNGVSDVDGDTLSVSNLQISNDTEGSVSLNGNFLSVNPSLYNSLAVGEPQVITATYDIEDGKGGVVSNSVTITINGANDMPILADPVFTVQSTDEDTAFTTSSILGNFSDPDTTDTLAVAEIDTNGTLGEVINNGDGTFDYDPNGQFESLQDGETVTDAFDYTVSDGNGGTVSDTVTVTINGVNDAPVNTVPASQTVNEDTGLDITGISVNDVDGNLATTQISVTAGSLVVDLTDGATITDGENGVTPSLTLSGTQAQINSALASLNYQGDPDFNGTDTLTVLSMDSAGTPLSDTGEVTITVNPVNDAPTFTVGANQVVNEDAGAQTVASQSANSRIYWINNTTDTIQSSNLDGTDVQDIISLTGFVDEVEIDRDGGKIYWREGTSIRRANLDGTNTETISGSVSGAIELDLSNNKLYYISRTESNSPRLLNRINLDGTNSEVLFELNPDNVSGGSIADLAIDTVNNNVYWTNTKRAIGRASLDGDGTDQVAILNGSAEANISPREIEVDPTGGKIYWTANDANRGISRANLDGTGKEVLFNNVNLALGFDIDIANGKLYWTNGNSDGNISNGNQGSVQRANFDGTGLENLVSDLPLASFIDLPGLSLAIDSDSASGAWVTDISAGSPNEADQNLTFNVVGNDNPELFSVQPTVSPEGVLTYTPAPNQNGTATVTIELADDGGTEDGGLDTSPTQTFSITVNPVNDAPTVGEALTSTATEEDGEYSINLLAGASDIDTGDVLNIANLVFADGANTAGVAISGNQLDITPADYNSLAANESAVINATYDVIDGQGGTVAQSVTITVAGENDAPTVTGAVINTATEDAPNYSVNLLDNASDVDTSDVLNIANLTFSGGVTPAGVTINGNSLDINTDTYNSLAVGESAEITATYDVVDGEDGTVAQSVEITIAGENDAPTVTSEVTSTTTEDAPNYSVNLLDNASDVDTSDVLNIANLTFSGGVTPAGVTINGNSLDINPDTYNSLAVGESAEITATYDVVDGNGGTIAQSVEITIAGENDAPTVTSEVTSMATEDDASYSVDLLENASDVDTSDVLNIANLTFSGGVTPAGVTINGNSLDINPDAYNSLAVGESAEITATYDVVDGNGGTIAQSVEITIAGENDAPTVTGAVINTATEDADSYSVNLLENASDVDTSDVLNVANLVFADNANTAGVTLNNNQLEIDPDAYNSLATGESEVITATYDVVDGNGGTIAQNVEITIEGVNDSPVLDLSGTEDNDINFTADVAPNGNLISVVDSDLSLTDVDNATLMGATVSITNPLNGFSEFLTANLSGTNIIRDYNPQTGVLTLTGEDSVANYQQVLRTVEYTNILNSGFESTLNLEFVVTDGDLNSTVATSTINLAADTTVLLENGNLSITDTNGGTTTDGFTLALNPDSNTVKVTTNSSVAVGAGINVIDGSVEVPVRDITAGIKVDSLSARDTLTVDFSNIDLLPANAFEAIAFDASSPNTSPGDILELQGSLDSGNAFDLIKHQFTSQGDGQVRVNNQGNLHNIDYTELEFVVDELDADDRIFNFDGGAETITLDDNESSSDNQLLIGSTIGAKVSFANPNNSLVINAGIGNDLVKLGGLDSNFAANLVVNGGNGGDRIFGSSNSYILNGGAGRDLIRGGAGADILNGGAGVDILDYRSSSEAVTIDLETGTADGGDATGDTISNFEQIYSSSFDDNLTGDAKNNILVGLAGNDTIDGGDGRDVIRGGVGADILDGGTGFDILSYRSSQAGVAINLATGTADGGDATGDSFTSFERVYGSNFNDNLTGNYQSNILHGFDGSDIIDGGAGNDNILSGNGKDFLTGGSGEDTFILSKLTESLLSDFNVITDLNIGFDAIDAPTAIDAANVTYFGNLNLFTEAEVVNSLTSLNGNQAAVIEFDSRTFVAINDELDGFDATNDAIIEITNYAGDINDLAII